MEDKQTDETPSRLPWWSFVMQFIGALLLMVVWITIFAVLPVGVCMICWGWHPAIGIVAISIWVLILVGDASQRPL